MVRLPPVGEEKSSPRFLRLSTSVRMRWAAEMTSRPGSVSPVMRLRRREKISKPSSDSSSLICLLMPGCDVCRASAAAEMWLPRRYTSQA
ncbi:hypothetical protein D3C83_21840 [compost metagenome]